MKKLPIFLLLIISSYAYGQAGRIPEQTYRTDLVYRPSITGTLVLDSNSRFHSAVDGFKPKLDTVKIIIVYIDTATYGSGTWARQTNHLQMWDFAYSVRENYLGVNPANYQPQGEWLSGVYYLPTEQWRHKSYLDKNKNPLDKSTIIIQSIEIK